MAYGGTFGVDPDTAEITAITIQTTSVPKGLTFCAADLDMTYHSVVLGYRSFALPREVTLRVHHMDGGGTQSAIHFSECHEFVGESKLLFNMDETGILAKLENGQARRLPEGLPVNIP